MPLSKKNNMGLKSTQENRIWFSLIHEQYGLGKKIWGLSQQNPSKKTNKTWFSLIQEQ